jgi:AcrR family transcriptional regulator
MQPESGLSAVPPARAAEQEESEAWRGDPLPRGRHRLPRGAVRESQRERLLQAMLELVASQGYAATTIAQVAKAARVSPNQFYAYFSGKPDCFLAVCHRGASELLEHLLALGLEPDWRDGVHKGVRTYLAWWRDRPQVSRAYLLELPSAGVDAVAERAEVYERFEEMFLGMGARARRENPDLPPVSRLAIGVLVAGMTEVVANEVRAGRIDDLLELEDELAGLVITLLT